MIPNTTSIIYVCVSSSNVFLVLLYVQVSIGQDRLSPGLDPAEDYSLVEMYDTDQSVVMATRRIRQLGLLGNEIAEHARHHHLDLKRLDVLCTNLGMQVQLEFLEPFDGIVYSKGQFDNPKCRYVETCCVHVHGTYRNYLSTSHC